MYVYFNEWRSDRVLVRLGLNTLIGWLHAVCMYVCMYVCIYVCSKPEWEMLAENFSNYPVTFDFAA